MKYRLRQPPVEPHFWSPDNPHPAQAEAHELDGIVIATYGSGSGCRRRYLKNGDVILPTKLDHIFEVMTREQFDQRYEPAGE